MLKIVDIQNAAAAILKEKTGFRVYRNDVNEAYVTPCFFINTTLEYKPEKRTFFRCRGQVSIFFFQKLKTEKRIRDEIVNEQMMQTLFTAFNPNFPVNDRVLTTSNHSFSYAGEVGDILNYTFDLDFFDSFSPEDKEDPDEGKENIEEAKTHYTKESEETENGTS